VGTGVQDRQPVAEDAEALEVSWGSKTTEEFLEGR
jgi:hypothetical protein